MAAIQMTVKRPLISFIVAMDANRIIGVDGGLPWHLPDDMRRFKRVTMGKPIIMGRKTYESIPSRFRPLAGRHNIVLTRDRSYRAESCTVVHTIEAALAAAGEQEEVMIGGGAQLYRQLLPMAGRIYLTIIDAEFDGDAYFPQLDMTRWEEVQREEREPDARNPYRYRYVTLERRDQKAS